MSHVTVFSRLDPHHHLFHVVALETRGFESFAPVLNEEAS
jgi:hypothetical protein